MSTTNPDLPFVEEDVVLDVDNSTEVQDDSMLKISNSKLSSKKRTVVNILKSYLGASVLAIPMAFSEGGLIVSIACYLLVAAVAVYCMLLLVKCKRYLVQHQDSLADFKQPRIYKANQTYLAIESSPEIESRRESLDDSDGLVASNKLLQSPKSSSSLHHSSSHTSTHSHGNSSPRNRDIISDSGTDPEDSISFEDVGQILFGKWGRRSVDLCLLSSQLGFCVVYQIFLGDNIHGLFPRIPKILCMFLPVPLLILLCQIRRLRWLAATSGVALAVFMTGFVITLTFSIKRPEFGHLELRMAPKSIASFATLLSFAVFSFEGIGLVLPVENAVRPDIVPIFSRLFTATVGLVTVIYTLVGALGYVAWGDKVGSSLIDNLIETQGKSIWVTLVVVGFLIGGFCSYPLNMYPVTTRLEQIFNLADSHGNPTADTYVIMWKRTLLRTLLVLLALSLALAIPSFGLFISLIGSLFSTALAFVFPTLFHMKLFSWPSYWKSGFLELGSSPYRQSAHNRKPSKFLEYIQAYSIVIFDILVCLFGIIATVVCTIVSVQNIAIAVKNGTIGWSFQTPNAPST